ncbi:hypothetical protein Goshw_023410, partial [Gossypium schwendimanii]|nr:hypothetical protein [Gossypium schwendimanii]
MGWGVKEKEEEEEEEEEKRKILKWFSSSIRLWIATKAVGQASQRIVPVTRTVESFSSLYPTKCTISSYLMPSPFPFLLLLLLTSHDDSSNRRVFVLDAFDVESAMPRGHRLKVVVWILAWRNLDGEKLE